MVHFFDSDIAQKYGVNAAVLACFLWDCIEEQSTQSPRLHDCLLYTSDAADE